MLKNEKVRTNVVVIQRLPNGEHTVSRISQSVRGKTISSGVVIEAFGNSLQRVLTDYKDDLGLPVQNVIRRLERTPDFPEEVVEYRFRT